MRVLVTGSAGLVGAAVCERLSLAGVEIAPFDLADGLDVRDAASVAEAMAGCSAVVHAAALLEGPHAAAIADTNVKGTANVLAAAAAVGVSHFVQISSLAVLGVFKGRRPPDYLPLDEAHPTHPVSSYETTKLEAERLVLEAAEMHSLAVSVLRAPGVWSPDSYLGIEAARRDDPTFEFEPYWEYGAFIDVRDLAEAAFLGLTAGSGAGVVHVASSDVSTSGPTSLEWVRRLHPDVEWRGGADRDPYAGLVRLERARERLGWAPRYTWRRHVASRTGERGSDG